METNKNNNAGDNKSNTEGAAKNPLEGLNLDGLLDNPAIKDILKLLLSGGVAMAGNYFMWIKPMQEKMDEMNTKITEQDKRIKELEHELDSLLEDQEDGTTQRGNLKGSPNEYFNLNNRGTNNNLRRKYRHIRI